MRVPVRLTCLFAALVCSAAETSTVRAICDPSPLTMLWSSPAQGDTGVPLDADLLLIMDGLGPQMRVQLGDEILDEGEIPGTYDLGQLEPSTDYRVTISSPEALFEPLELTFTTGTTAAAGRSAQTVEVTEMHEQTVPDRPECGDIPCSVGAGSGAARVSDRSQPLHRRDAPFRGAGTHRLAWPERRRTAVVPLGCSDLVRPE
jgi:hypothetical protein